jgi:hypothetical protein
MKEIKLPGWNSFNNHLIDLNELRKRLCHESKERVSELLFRGQPDKSLGLITSLERYLSKKQLDAREYFETARKAHSEIASFTGKTWQVNRKDFDDWEKDINPLFNRGFPAQEYMIYLRQHGFPSPLLDWSKSPYIAAYFSFTKIPEDADRVAIYAYIEWAGKGKSQSSNNPVITTIPERKPTHRRHYIQQCKYTICLNHIDNKVFFKPHEEAFPQTADGEQLLWKLTLPVSERIDALRNLDQMNVNGASLFNTEDSLMETVALRSFFFSKADF